LGIDARSREILSFIEGFAPPRNGFELSEEGVRAGARNVIVARGGARSRIRSGRGDVAAGGVAAAGGAARERGHGRAETWTRKAAHVSRLEFPGAREAIKITRWRQDTATGKTSRQAVYAVTSLTSATPGRRIWPGLAASWSIEAHHHVRDMSFRGYHPWPCLAVSATPGSQEIVETSPSGDRMGAMGQIM
jgi:hypothetical protein